METSAKASPSTRRGTPRANGRPRDAVEELVERAAALRPFPAILDRIRETAADPKKTLADLAHIVEHDIAFSARLLRIVNSAGVALVQRCTSIRHATALLGTKRIVDLATATAAHDLVHKMSRKAPALAAHAVAVAGLARVLASNACVSPDEAFTVGLLHDVGMLILLESGTDDLYEELVDQAYGGEASIADERALLGFDHAVVGTAAMRAWRLPDPFAEVVACHHDWEAALACGGAVPAFVGLVRTADLLVERLDAREAPDADDLEALRNEPAIVHLGLSPEQVAEMWPGLRRVCATERASVEALVGKPTDGELVAAPVVRAVAPAPFEPDDDGVPPYVWAIMGTLCALAVGGGAAIVFL